MSQIETQENIDSSGRWKSYPAYKASSIHWIGNIPNYWQIKRIKHTTYVKGRIGWKGLRSEEFIDEGPYLVTGTDFVNGKVSWSSCYHISEDRYLEDPYIQLKEGDLLITKDGTIGKVAVVSDLQGEATLNSGIFLTRQITNHSIPEFMFWVISSDVFMNFIDYTKAGSTISHLYQNVFEEFTFPVPPLPEQSSIAAFLDRETSRIDTLITKKQRQIELLQEKRTALISHAVTKGLNPEAKMKDSGIEWLGEIPEHWVSCPIKRVSTSIQTGCTPPTAKERYYEDGTIPWYGPGSFGTNLILSDSAKFLNEIAVREGVARLFDVDSIMVVSIGATIGKVGYLVEPSSSNQQITAIKPNQKILHGKFLAYQLKHFEPVLRGIAPSTTLPIMNQQVVGYLPCAFPPLEEQYNIVAFLDRETHRIKVLLSKVKESIEKLQEYRTALISAAVTGKIDVRKEVA